MKSKNYILIGGLVLAIILTGYLRSFVFENINEQLGYLYHQRDFSFVHRYFGFLKSWDYSAVYSLKWIAMIVFLAVYFIESWAGLVLLASSMNLRHLSVLYATVLSIAVLSFFVITIFENSQRAYLVTRPMIAFLQTPLPLMILLAGGFVRSRI